MAYCDCFKGTDINFSNEDIKSLNDFYNKVKEIDEVYFPKLMEVKEVLETRKILDEYFNDIIEDFRCGELIPLFHSDNTSDYIMYYNSGDYKGKAFYLSHDEIIIAPIFESLKEVTEYIIDKKEKFEFDYYSDFAERFKLIGVDIEL